MEDIDRVLRGGTPGLVRAVRAIVTGDVEAVRFELATDPSLAQARSASDHHATLLHYVAAGGVDAELQRQVPNADEIASVLLAASLRIRLALASQHCTTMRPDQSSGAVPCPR